MFRTKLIISFVFIIFAHSGLCTPQACQKEVAKYAAGMSWEILEKTRFVALDYHFGELGPDCQSALLNVLGQSESCLSDMRQFCKGTELNRANRKNCAIKNLSNLSYSCNSAYLSTCAAQLEKVCDKSDKADCVSKASALSKSLCRKIPSDLYIPLSHCREEIIKDCSYSKMDKSTLLLCLRRKLGQIGERCAKLVREEYANDIDGCWADKLTLCNPQEREKRQWVQCFKRQRPKLSPRCYNDFKFLLLHSSCMEKENSDCNKKEEAESVACLRTRKAKLSNECVYEINQWP